MTNKTIDSDPFKELTWNFNSQTKAEDPFAQFSSFAQKN